MVLPTWHIPPNMGGPEAQFGTLRGELEIGPKFGPPQPPWWSRPKPTSQFALVREISVILWRSLYTFNTGDSNLGAHLHANHSTLEDRNFTIMPAPVPHTLPTSNRPGPPGLAWGHFRGGHS